MLVNKEKQKKEYKAYERLPLSARPLDLIYFLFFAIHLPATLIIDLQFFYPPALVPSLMRGAVDAYISMSRDPLIGGVFGVFGPSHSSSLVWFKTFLATEALFQVPVFILGLRALYTGARSIYPLLIIYGASSATTTLACVAIVLAAPTLTPSILAQGTPGVTDEQRLLLLSSYIPFFVLALMMAVDMALRVSKLVEKGIAKEEEEKWE